MLVNPPPIRIFPPESIVMANTPPFGAGLKVRSRVPSVLSRARSLTE